jgi:hypothetical protein
MVVYNITTKVHHSIDIPWLQWQKERIIPETIATGCFTDARIFRLLDQDDSEGKTYALQFTGGSTESYQAYLNTHAAQQRRKAVEKWGDKIISFHSLLEVIH